MAGRTGLPPILALKPLGTANQLGSTLVTQVGAGQSSSTDNPMHGKIQAILPEEGEPKWHGGQRMREQPRGAGDIVRDAVASGSPRMDWWISLKLRAAPEFNKSAKPKPNINIEAGFLAWINVIVELGNDTTNSCLELVMENPASTEKKSKTDAAARAAQDANASKRPGLSQDHPDRATVAGEFDTLNVISKKLVELHKPNTKYETRLPVFLHLTKDNHYIPLTGAVLDIWAKALEKRVDRVSYYSPPASIKFVKISDAKRRRLDHERLRHGNSPSPESDPPALIEPNEDLLRKYIELVIKPEKQEKVMKILVDHDIAHPNSFKSKTITEEKMLKWGLSDGIVAQLRDNP
ncbi:hypothetical protein PSHT_08088 [Puccinia striiformis]|uniref:Uncharacterized protein n=1 Tax=Puccinia striiformis TaxID=27350 RepID=A0A2S4VSM4_9BASI|nr:hypothetical protein PSHT_08088 [Puccinia striiformis]